MAVRIVAALVGIIIGVSILAFDNIWLYTAVISFFSAVAVMELSRAVKCDKYKVLYILCIAFSAVVPFILIPFMLLKELILLHNLAVPVYGAFVLVLFAVMLANHSTRKFEFITMCGGAAILIPTSMSCIVLFRYSVERQSLGIFMVLYLLFCAWFGDSGAYFVGTFLGKHKLCPNVSPKKTVEGLIGGVVTVGVVVVIQCLIFNFFIPEGMTMNMLLLVPVGMAASLAGVLGDLSASVIKREFDVKDFGHIMPGHGGVLDRFDSVLFVAPFLYILFRYLDPVIRL